MTRCRLFSWTSAIAIAAIIVAACEEEPVNPFYGTAPPEGAMEIKNAGTEPPCPRFYFYQLIPDRAGNDRYCARILERCMGPNGRPREGCV